MGGENRRLLLLLLQLEIGAHSRCRIVADEGIHCTRMTVVLTHC